MSDLIKLCGGGVLALAATLILKDSKVPHPEFVPLLFGVCIIANLISSITNVIFFMNNIASGTAVEGYMKTLLKAAGIVYLTDITAELCRNSGEASIASYVEIAGKAELAVLALPLMSKLVDLSFGILNI